MYRSILFALLLVLGKIQAQKVVFPMKDSAIVFTELVENKSLNKAGIYKNVKIWFAESFNSSKDVLQMDDKDLGIILGKGLGTFDINLGGTQTPVGVKWTIKVEIKDNKCKMTVYDIQTSIGEGGQYIGIEYGYDSYQHKDLPDGFKESIEGIYLKTRQLIESFKLKIQKADNNADF
jgi:hypothetical protein